MISAILYGRNDAHGYNLHKRAAISLNAIAEVLIDPGDEIIFVDYNTPNDLPTFIGAIYDTLTARAKGMLRVLRVRPQQHARMVARTHLFALEPHSRNIAIRRANPENRWILFTNTDMVFVPRPGFTGISDAVRDLPDGQYILPRFELPEPLWESFPRSDPAAIMRACDELGRRLHLDEVALAFPYMRFDSPGDFQLMPRQALYDVHGFDERMIHGWHADSNMCKRLWLYYGGRSESLADRLRGYHCDHTRVATLAHRLDIKLENDLQEFVYGVTDPVAHHQADTWGAPSEAIEELDFARDPQARFVAALETALDSPQPEEYRSDSNDLRNFVFYHAEHVLAYVAGNLTVYPRDARFAYLGNNPRMLELLARAVTAMGFAHPLHYDSPLLSAGPAPPGAAPASGDILADYDLLIFDFGLDRTGVELPEKVERVTDWPRPLRYSLGRVAQRLERYAALSDGLSRERGHVPDFLVINANHHIFRGFVGQFFIATDTPYPTHVRKGRPRVGEERAYRSYGWKVVEDLMRSFFGYGEEDLPVATAGPGIVVDMTSSGQTARYKDGHWGAMDFTGSWIEGHRAQFLFAPPAGFAGDLIAFVKVNESFLSPDEEPMYVNVSFEGELLVRWTLHTRYEVTVCKAVLPARLLAGKTACRLEFHVENPQPAERMARARGQQLIGEDPRELGFKIQQIEFAGAERLHYELKQNLEFAARGQGQFHSNECWSTPDDLGQWTLGPAASIILLLKQAPQTAVNAVFTITDVAVSEQHPNLDVYVSVKGREMAQWKLGPMRLTDERRILLPAEMLRDLDPVTFSFRVETPRTPAELGWSASDLRPLGFRLARLRLQAAGPSTYRLGALIDFTEGGDSINYVEEFLGTEWALPDSLGSWTMGTLARVKIPLDAPAAGDLPAAFVLSDCVAARHVPQLQVTVRVNGVAVAEWALGPDREVHRRAITIPAAAVAGRQELLIAFEIPAPRSPASMGWSGDSRPLGFRLARAVIGRAEIEIPLFRKLVGAERPMWQRIVGLPQFALHVARLLYRRYFR